jgi:hypothetical protein
MTIWHKFIYWLRPCTRVPSMEGQRACEERLAKMAETRKALVRDLIEMVQVDQHEPKMVAHNGGRHSGLAGLR